MKFNEFLENELNEASISLKGKTITDLQRELEDELGKMKNLKIKDTDSEKETQRKKDHNAQQHKARKRLEAKYQDAIDSMKGKKKNFNSRNTSYPDSVYKNMKIDLSGAKK